MNNKVRNGLFIFIFSFVFLGIKVNAFDTSKIKLSNSIYFPWLIVDNIDIGLNDSYKDNNSFIKY